MLKLTPHTELMYDTVGAMQSAFGHPVFDETREFSKIPVEEFHLRLKLITEELGETLDAHRDSDEIEFVDGICDTLVVSFGLLHVFNVPSTIIKNIANEVDAHDFDTSIESLTTLQQFFNSWKEALEDENTIKQYEMATDDEAVSIYDETAQMTCVLISVCLSFADNSSHFNLLWNFNEVMRSNMTKVIIKKETAEKEAEERDLTVEEIKLLGATAYVLKNEDGKVQKPEAFSKPEIKILKKFNH